MSVLSSNAFTLLAGDRQAGRKHILAVKKPGPHIFRDSFLEQVATGEGTDLSWVHTSRVDVDVDMLSER